MGMKLRELVLRFWIDGAAIGYAFRQILLALISSIVAYNSFDLPWREPGKSLPVWSFFA
jgi:hypothetical protein